MVLLLLFSILGRKASFFYQCSEEVLLGPSLKHGTRSQHRVLCTVS